MTPDNGLTAGGDRDIAVIADWLLMAGNSAAAHVNLRKWEADEHAARVKRIDMLDTLIAEYRERLAILDDLIAKDPKCVNEMRPDAFYLHRDYDRGLREVVQDLERLRESEAAMDADWTAPPRARPTSTKNEYAMQIYRMGLGGVALKRSQKCLLIADLLIAAGVDDRPRENVQASLVEMIRNKP